MPICNVVDKRINKYDVNADVVYEPSFNDNCVKGSTQFEFKYFDNHWHIDWKYNTTIQDAIQYAYKWKEPVTMFLYDCGSQPCD